MRNSKLFVWLALSAGMALPGASTLAAQDWRDVFRERRDVRSDYRDMGRDMGRDRDNLDRARADIARDQWQLNEAIRCGRSAEAARIAADLARDQQALRAQMRDTQGDRYDAYYDRRDLRRDYRGTRDYRYGWR
jgi:hypothetical protein